MTTTKVTLRGVSEESDPVQTCVCCEVGTLPFLDINAGETNVIFKFVCPNCGAETPTAFGYLWAKRLWNDGRAQKIIPCQKRIGDF